MEEMDPNPGGRMIEDATDSAGQNSRSDPHQGGTAVPATETVVASTETVVAIQIDIYNQLVDLYKFDIGILTPLLAGRIKN
jgi:hypothetical protein